MPVKARQRAGGAERARVLPHGLQRGRAAALLRHGSSGLRSSLSLLLRPWMTKAEKQRFTCEDNKRARRMRSP
ncbi:MAG: hypothetical protein BGN87_01235 [Rhizobiales bacterium 65-79]|nr:MAG: hypothetical protein BGN87_01235 [Rhizobiales bacterium 65-79]